MRVRVVAGRSTAADALRVAALARLVVGGADVELHPGHHGIGLAQAALRAGCNRIGVGLDADPDEIARHVRDAGFTPVPAPVSAGA